MRSLLSGCMSNTYSHKLSLSLLGISFYGVWLLTACAQQSPPQSAPVTDAVSNETAPPPPILIPGGQDLGTRIPAPPGYQRVPLPDSAFGAYLRKLPLKAHDSPVHLHTGELKSRQDVHVAVIDLDVGKRDLQQCADAVMRLRGEYLFAQGDYPGIRFHFTNGFPVDFQQWGEGRRVSVQGNRCTWYTGAGRDFSHASFRRFMDLVFTYAGTLSLEKELKAVPLADLQVGDVFIRGGSPGHAVIVMEVAEQPSSGKKQFILAQSYMPAQEIHILRNPLSESGSPWYPLDFGQTLYTPEWTFQANQLRRFP